MGFNRMEAKMAAKISMRQTKPNPIWTTLLFALLTTVVKQVAVAVVGDPFVEAFQYLQMNYDPYDVFEYVFLRNLAHTGLYAATILVLSIYHVVMNYGYVSYALRMARNEQPGYRNLFDGFARVGRVIWASILCDIFLMLWSLLAMMPSFVMLVLVGLFAESQIVGLLVLLYYITFMAAMVVILAISYRYRLTRYILVDMPECTALDAIRASKETMRGWKMELFTLDMSFIGWNILTVLTFGVLGVWVLPYQYATEANFYDCVSAGSRDIPPQQQEPFDYDYHSL